MHEQPEGREERPSEDENQPPQRLQESQYYYRADHDRHQNGQGGSNLRPWAHAAYVEPEEIPGVPVVMAGATDSFVVAVRAGFRSSLDRHGAN